MTTPNLAAVLEELTVNEPDLHGKAVVALEEVRKRLMTMASPVLAATGDSAVQRAISPADVRTDTVEIDEDDLELLRPPSSAAREVRFEDLPKGRIILLLNDQRAQINHVERVLADNFDFYWNVFVAPITDKPTAIAAVAAYSPGILLDLPLTLKQVDAMLSSLRDRVAEYGVPSPLSWSTTAREVLETPEEVDG